MKVFVLCFMLAVAVIALVGAQEAEFHTADSKSIIALLGDNNFISDKLKCLLNKRPCDKFGSSLKTIVREILHNNCAKCTPQTKANAKLLLEHLKRYFPSDYNALLALYK